MLPSTTVIWAIIITHSRDDVLPWIEVASYIAFYLVNVTPSSETRGGCFCLGRIDRRLREWEIGLFVY